MTKDKDKDNEKIVKLRPEKPIETHSQLNRQVGGEHYKNAKIQPIELIVAHKLDFIDGCIVKYATRQKKGESKIEKYQKIIHYAMLALELKE